MSICGGHGDTLPKPSFRGGAWWTHNLNTFEVSLSCRGQPHLRSCLSQSSSHLVIDWPGVIKARSFPPNTGQLWWALSVDIASVKTADLYHSLTSLLHIPTSSLFDSLRSIPTKYLTLQTICWLLEDWLVIAPIMICKKRKSQSHLKLQPQGWWSKLWFFHRVKPCAVTKNVKEYSMTQDDVSNILQNETKAMYKAC